MNIIELHERTGVALATKGEVKTKFGPRILHSGPVTEKFWDLWRSSKDELKNNGISVSRDDSGRWSVNLWEAVVRKSEGSVFSKEAIAASNATDSDFVTKFPDGVTPRPFQKTGIEYAVDNSRPRVIIGDEMGLGKTIQACGVANHMNVRRALVVCPSGLKINWQREWNRFTTTQIALSCIDSGKDTDIAKNSAGVVVSYNMFTNPVIAKLLKAREWDIVILDEAHYLQNRTTKRSVEILGTPRMTKKQLSAGKKEIAPINSAKWVMLSGTPITNRPENFWNLLRFCSPDIFGDWWKFAFRYCGAEKTRFGVITSGSSNKEELRDLVRGTCMIRRRKKEVLKELPDKIRQIIEIEMPQTPVNFDPVTLQEVNDWSERADRMREAMASAKEANDTKGWEDAAESLAECETFLFSKGSKIRKELGLAKCEAAIEMIGDALEQDPAKKIIIGAHHKEVIDTLRKSLEDYGVVVLTGSCNKNQRQHAVDEFQTNPNVRVFIGNIIAAGTGNTLTASSHVMIVEPDWVPSNNEQFEDRAHRIGQKNCVLVQYIVISGTIDARIIIANAKKRSVIEATLDSAGRTEDSVLEAAVSESSSETKPFVRDLQGEKKLADTNDERRRHLLAMAEAGRNLTIHQVTLAHECVRILAGMDSDHARVVNGQGFSKLDGERGHGLALTPLSRLSDIQKFSCYRMAWKYRRQLPQKWFGGEGINKPSISTESE